MPNDRQKDTRAGRAARAAAIVSLLATVAIVAACASRSSEPAASPTREPNATTTAPASASAVASAPRSADECVVDGDCARRAPAGSIGECRGGRCVTIPAEELDCGPSRMLGTPARACPAGFRCVKLPVGPVAGEMSDAAPTYRCRRAVAANESRGPA